jgi:protein O-GlcNAc transferase
MSNNDARQARTIAAKHLRNSQYQEAIPPIKELLEADPLDHGAWLMLAAANAGLQRYDLVIDCCRRVIAIQPNNSAAHYNLGIALLQQGDTWNAASSFSEASRLSPDRPEIHFYLGNTLMQLGQYDRAAQCYHRVLALTPEHAVTYNSLCAALLKSRKFSSAIQACAEAIRLQPEYAEAYTNLGNALGESGQYDKAIASHQRAISLNPELAPAHYNLGNALVAVNRFTDAVVHYEESLCIDPNLSDVKGNLANALGFCGEIQRALAVYRNALEFNPHDVISHSGLLLSMIYAADTTPAQLYKEHVRWNSIHCGSIVRTPVHRNPTDPGRTLRICYVSADFRSHSIAWFIEPLLENHDRNNFEIFCYHNNYKSDRTTERLMSLSGKWSNVAELHDDALAAKIRDDAIDILVDLAGHTAGNRLLAFARKPASLQVTWLGYPCTTGMDAIDYRITDNLADPPGSDQFYTETLLRLPHSFICYKAPAQSPSVGPLPLLKTGHVTFGSFNMLSKLTPEVIKLWSTILRELPGSRIILKNNSFLDPKIIIKTGELFKKHGVTAPQLELVAWKPSLQEHLELYNRIDISLDTFPYNGTTTSLESLWMGSPFITLAGNQHAGRVGSSILGNLSLDELIADTHEDYLNIVRSLAADTHRLSTLRSNLRSRLQESYLCDASGFTRNFESALRIAWSKSCAQE